MAELALRAPATADESIEPRMEYNLHRVLELLPPKGEFEMIRGEILRRLSHFDEASAAYMSEVSNNAQWRDILIELATMRQSALVELPVAGQFESR